MDCGLWIWGQEALTFMGWIQSGEIRVEVAVDFGGDVKALLIGGILLMRFRWRLMKVILGDDRWSS